MTLPIMREPRLAEGVVVLGEDNEVLPSRTLTMGATYAGLGWPCSRS